MAVLDLNSLYPAINMLGQIPSGGGGFGQSLTQYLPNINTALANPTGGGGGTVTGLPRTAEQLAALGLLGYAMRPQKDVTAPSIYDLRSPYGTSAVNYLQGVYEAPPDPFAPGGLYSKYLPAFEQTDKDLFNNIQQSIIAGLPQSAATPMGGSELAAIREGFLSRALPQRLALQADLMRETLNRQLGAAGTVYGGESDLQKIASQNEISAAIMNAATETERNKYLAQLGTALLLAGRGGGATTGLPGIPGGGAPTAPQGAGGGLGQAIQKALGLGGQVLPTPQQVGQLSPAELAAQVARIGGLQFRTASGELVPIGIEEAQQLAAQGYGNQIVTSGQTAAAVGRDFGLPGAGLLGPAGTGSATALLSSLGSGAGGYLLGREIGGRIGKATDSQALGALGGWFTGGLTGGAIGGPVGAAIGAIAGGLGGFLDTRKGQHEVKEAFRTADLDSQADQIAELGSFFTQQLGALGVDTTPFQREVSRLISASPGPGDEQTELATLGGKTLLAAMRQANPQITSLTQVPGLREEMIDYLTRSTFTASNSRYSGGPPIESIHQWANLLN